MCYIYITTPFRKRDDGKVADPHDWDPALWSPASGWTDEPLQPQRSGWSQFFSGVAIAIVVACGAVIVIAVMVVIAVVAAVHQLDNSKFNLFGSQLNVSGIPDPSSPPSAYGLNAVVSQNGKTMFVTEPASNDVLVLDLVTGKVLLSLPTGPTPAGLSISPNGREVWVADAVLSEDLVQSGEVTVISRFTNGVAGTVTTGGNPLDVALNPGGSRAYVTENGVFAPGSVAIVNATTLRIVGQLKPLPSQAADWYPTSVAVTPDDRQVWVSTADVLGFTGNNPGFVYVFSAATDEELTRISVGHGAFFMTLSRDGRYAYVADKLSCDVSEIDTSSFRVIATVPTPASDGCPYGIAATSTDGVVDTVTGSDNTLNLGKLGDVLEQVDFRTPRVRVVHGVGPDPVTVTMAPSGGRAYVLDANSPFVTVVDTRDDKVLGTLNLEPGAETSISTHQDGPVAHQSQAR